MRYKTFEGRLDCVCRNTHSDRKLQHVEAGAGMEASVRYSMPLLLRVVDVRRVNIYRRTGRNCPR